MNNLLLPGLLGVAILGTAIYSSNSEQSIPVLTNEILDTKPKSESGEELKVTESLSVPTVDLSTSRVEKKENKEKDCHPSYGACLNAQASDYDCAGGTGNGPYYTGPVQVYGYDEFDLDRDNDGWGCE